MSLSGLSDEILLEIGQDLSPQELCFAYQATRADTSAFADGALIRKSIVEWLKKALSDKGETYFTAPIMLGTQDIHSTDVPQTQAQYIIQQLEKFFKQSTISVDQLKMIYAGINQQATKIESKVVPGLFNRATPLMQQRACLALAEVSVNHPEAAHFLMAFAKTVGLNVNARGEYNQTALEAKVFAGDVVQIQFLREKGANIFYLSQQALSRYNQLIEKSHQRSPLRCAL